MACCLFFTVFLSAQHLNPDKVICSHSQRKIVHMVQRVYPPEARTDLIEGDVVLREENDYS